MDEVAPAGPSGLVFAVVLAAGRSSRMGGPNKLMAQFAGEPLVRKVAAQAAASKAAATFVVTGHQAERVTAALRGLALRIVRNPDFASGLAASLKAGVAALPRTASGALIVLGDMPGVRTADLDRMIDAFEVTGGKVIVRATANGRRGNPVILPRSLFPDVAGLEGDTGARRLVEAGPVIDVEFGCGAETDVDTPEAMALAGGVLQD